MSEGVGNSGRFARLEDVILDELYPEVDLALRRGRHIDRDDAAWYTFLVDAEDHLEPLYRRFGCELIHRSDGYFYLLPTSDALGRRHLSSGEMLVGQALTLLYLEPATLEHGGAVTREQVLGHLAGVVGADSLMRAMNPKRRRHDERIAQETVRNKVTEALRRLSTLGFVEVLEDDRVRLRPSLMRFAEPVRGTKAPEATLARLVAEGELVLAEDDAAGDGGAESEDETPRSEEEASAADDDAVQTVSDDELESAMDDDAVESIADDDAVETVPDDDDAESVADEDAVETVPDDDAIESVASDDAGDPATTGASDDAGDPATTGASDDGASDPANPEESHEDPS
ncbi:chromosome partition protein MukE [Pendulispora albinea]|uniref:Chromosome partition protein MukE n=1 Tax=Pendulispora albinea TaxID=2741071 RepID=A0ABZ2LSS8_9BACT